MNRLEGSNQRDIESNMEWLGIRILNLIADGTIVLPKNIKEIKKSDQIVNDIGFGIAHIYTDAEIVTFFQKLEDFSSPFSSDGDYQNYVMDGMEQQERDLDESQDNEDRNEVF